MAQADLVFRVFADTKELKSGVSAAKKELDNLAESATGAGSRLISALPPTVATEAKKIGGAVGALAGAFGGLGGVMAGLGIVGIANDFLNTTGALTDLSSQTDVTVRDLQRFQYAGDLVGVSLESITTAVSQLQNRLGSGDKSAFSAIDQLGLSMKELQRLDPGQQFEVISSALSGIADANKRAALAQDLFGRGFITLMPLLRSNLKEVADKAFIMSDATVRAGEAAGDTITKFLNFGKVFTANLLTPVVRWAEDLQDAFADLGRNIDVVRGKMGSLPAVPQAPTSFGGKGGPADITMSLQEAERVTEQLNRKIEKAFEDSKKRAAEAAVAYRELTTAAQELVYRGIDVQIAKERELFGQSVTSGLIASLRASRTEMDLLQPVQRDMSVQNEATTATLHAMIDAGMRLPAVTEEQRKQFLQVKDATVSWRDSMTDLAQAMTQLAQTAGSGFVSSMASVVNAINVGTKAVDSLKGGFANLTSGKGLSSILSGFTGIVGGIGGIVSAAQTAIQIGKALFNLFDRDKGRDLVEQFAATFEGGFDGPNGLHAQLLKLGAEGEALWIKLTQGVGRNNPDQARSAIEEVQRALAGLTKTIHDGVGAVLDGFENRGITIPVTFDVDDGSFPSGTVPALGSGGIVQRPTLALVGESGPEAVVPLGQLASTGGGNKALLAEIQGMRADYRRLADDIFRAVRDGTQLRTA